MVWITQRYSNWQRQSTCHASFKVKNPDPQCAKDVVINPQPLLQATRLHMLCIPSHTIKAAEILPGVPPLCAAVGSWSPRCTGRCHWPHWPAVGHKGTTSSHIPTRQDVQRLGRPGFQRLYYNTCVLATNPCKRGHTPASRDVKGVTVTRLGWHVAGVAQVMVRFYIYNDL